MHWQARNTVLQSAYVLSYRPFHDYNCVQWPQQQGETTQLHKHAQKSVWLWVAAFYWPFLAETWPFWGSAALGAGVPAPLKPPQSGPSRMHTVEEGT